MDDTLSKAVAVLSGAIDADTNDGFAGASPGPRLDHGRNDRIR
jgi:hypothetical protein